MKSVLIVAHGNLPVPNVLGGAVESLMQYLIEENEERGENHFTIVSPYHEEAVVYSKKYMHTDFVFFKSMDGKLKWLIDVIRFKLFRLFPSKSTYCKSVEKYIKINSEKFDYIVFENNPAFLRHRFTLNYTKAFFHMHNDWFNDDLFDNVRLQRLLVSNAKRLKRVLCVSSYIESRAKRFGLSNTLVLNNGCRISDYDNEDVQKNGLHLREELGIPEGTIVFSYCGRLVKEKGVLELIEAFSKVHSPNVRLLVIGGADYSSNMRTEYVKSVNELAERDSRVRLLGYIKREVMPIYYAACDIVVIPTAFVEEAAPLTALEGMAAKKPLIVSDSGHLKWWGKQENVVMVSRGDGYINRLTNAMEQSIKKHSEQTSPLSISNSLCCDVKQYYDNFISSLNCD